jgi:hypothetical protein
LHSEFIRSRAATAACAFLKIDFAPGVGQKLAGLDRAIPLRKFCEKFLELDIIGECRRIHFDDKYLEQYERMQRSYDRFREINSRLADKVSSDYEDDVFAFFMHCYHLKDWVKNEASVKSRMPNIGTDVERFINESEALSLCTDLCNSLKRLELKRSSSGERPTFGLRQYHHRLGLGSGGSIRLEWLVERNNKPPIDAFKLATERIAEWDKFLQRLQSQIL